MHKVTLLAIILCFFTVAAFAQQPDTVKTKNKADSITRQHDKRTSELFVPKVKKEKVYHPDSTHLPHTAVMRSLEVPGWGQVYNHQWWKVPFIYGGLGALGYSIYYNHGLYVSYENEAIRRRNGDYTNTKYKSYTGGYSVFSDAANNANRNFQISILGFAAVWGVNVIDAYIQAKFQHVYTMDNNFSMNVTPGVIAQPAFASNNIGTFTPVLKFTFVLR